jgi:hypothetical protein
MPFPGIWRGMQKKFGHVAHDNGRELSRPLA